ncbi:SWIM zinc finger family protein [Streptacidiphilus pinicola]|uniref:SWIM zinc finger family protein n=1 Tax=Streptacidiphilus pinicola TaxID=2219663 RepID=A0A2X0KJN7_9ACTN|nr:SWIM zinc finger family protein [Streptacidiphilus pinicola]RAG86930.1 SWIM zinc finger family protein [Streptacidiphilus pinicola]
MNDRWTTDHVLSLAPDASSQKAAAKLGRPDPWSGTGASAEAVWGACKGSGSRPYQTVVALDGPAYHCSCPSRKFPCKHALGLLLLWSADTLTGAGAPEWAESWLSGRRRRAERASADMPGDAASGGAAPGDDAGSSQAGPRDEAAAAARRQRREARVASGAEELLARLADQLRGGLAEAPSRGYAFWDGVAARMVDAQAPGLASRARDLGALPASGAQWPTRLLEEYAMLHLLATGYQGRDALPAPLAATVRSRVGFTVDNAEVLRTGPLVRDRWLVLGSRDTSDDRLTTRRLWLRGTQSGRDALLLSFGRPGVAPELSLPTGLELDAELAFHPTAPALRAALGPRHAAPAAPSAPHPAGGSVDAALGSYAAALGDDPWLDSWPAVITEATPVPTDHGWQLVDATGAVPLFTPSPWRLLAASTGRPLTVFGECGHRGFHAVTCWTDNGPLTL